MSARNLSLQQHLDAGQLPMFMTSTEIRNNFAVDEDKYKPGDTDDSNVWKRALKESKTKYPGEKTSRYQEFKQNGVQTPIELGKVQGEPMIYDGHHRIASMEKIDPNRLLPVEFHKEYMKE